MKQVLLASVLVLVAACGAGDVEEASVSGLAETLESNTSWPFEVVGVLQIEDAGGYGDSEYPDWAVGSLITEDTDEYGIPISIGEAVVSRAGIDIDSGEKVRVWLDPRGDDDFGGAYFYPVTRIERL